MISDRFLIIGLKNYFSMVYFFILFLFLFYFNEINFFRIASDAVYDNVELDELMMQMRDAETLEEQGDILHYLVCISSIFRFFYN